MKRLKRLISIISMLLLLTMAFSATASAVNVGDFRDVTFNEWFQYELFYAVEKGLVNGTSATTFSPNNTMTRAEFVTIVGRAAGVTGVSGTKFTDVESDSWYGPYVYWAAENGIVKGTSDTTFSPKDNITRQDMATIIGRLVNAYNLSLSEHFALIDKFADADDIADYAMESIELLRKASILRGDDKGNVNPRAEMTRAEGVAVLVRTINQTGGFVISDEGDENEGSCEASETGYHLWGDTYIRSDASEDNNWVEITYKTCKACGFEKEMTHQYEFSDEWRYTHAFHFRPATNAKGLMFKDLEYHVNENVWYRYEAPCAENGWKNIYANTCQVCGYLTLQAQN